MSSFFLKANSKSKMLRNSYMIFFLKRWKVNRKIKGKKTRLRGCSQSLLKTAVINRKGNQSSKFAVTKFANFHFENIITTRKTTYKTYHYMVSINECWTNSIKKKPKLDMSLRGRTISLRIILYWLILSQS